MTRLRPATALVLIAWVLGWALLGALSMVGCDARADVPSTTSAVDPSVTWAQLGTALGAILSAAAAAGGSGYVAARRATGGGLSEDQAAMLTRIDERTQRTETSAAVLEERTREFRVEQRRIRETLHKHGQALAVLLAEHDLARHGRPTLSPVDLDDDEPDPEAG